MSTVDFDDVLVQIGERGRYQLVMYYLLCIPATVPAAFLAFSQVFVSASPDHWCRLPSLEHVLYGKCLLLASFYLMVIFFSLLLFTLFFFYFNFCSVTSQTIDYYSKQCLAKTPPVNPKLLSSFCLLYSELFPYSYIQKYKN